MRLGFLVFLLCFVWLSGCAQPEPEPKAEGTKQEKEQFLCENPCLWEGGEYTILSKAVWSKTKGNGFLKTTADAFYLSFKMSFKNKSQEPMIPASFKLIDESGAEYSESGTIGEDLGFSDINPGVKKEGTLSFDIPKGKKYSLKIKSSPFADRFAVMSLIQ